MSKPLHYHLPQRPQKLVIFPLSLFLFLVFLFHVESPILCSVCRRSNETCDALWNQKIEMRDEALNRRTIALANPKLFADNKTKYDPFEPSWNCHIEQRVGKEFGDGGKFLCGGLNYFSSRSEACLVYSVGSNGDFSFETSIKKAGCEVHTFDPSGDTLAWEEKAASLGVHYHAWGLRGEAPLSSKTTFFNSVTNTHNPLLTLMEIRNQLTHDGRKIDILKVDCEGCEWAAFKLIFDDVIQGRYRVGQILIEVHGLDFEKIEAFFKHANQAKFYIFHKERNHWGCNGYKCLEYALIEEGTAHEIFKHTHQC